MNFTRPMYPAVGLAPMAGVSDMPFRILCQEQGAGWAVTEMLSAKGYLYNPLMRANQELLIRDPAERQLGLQLFGHEPELMAEAAARLEDQFDFIDINMGCPAHKIVGGGDGCALMKSPALAGRIIEAVVRRVQKPVTVKTRAGWDEWHINGPEICRIAQESGASAVTLHARTREQFYAGKADWSLIASIVASLHIPVIGNGDVTCGEDAVRMFQETGCAGIVIGRGAQGNPWIFREIQQSLKEAGILTNPSEKGTLSCSGSEQKTFCPTSQKVYTNTDTYSDRDRNTDTSTGTAANTCTAVNTGTAANTGTSANTGTGTGTAINTGTAANTSDMSGVRPDSPIKAASLSASENVPVRATKAERIQMALRHMDMEVALRGERSAVLEMRKHIAWYLAGFPGCVKIRAQINALSDVESVRKALLQLEM